MLTELRGLLLGIGRWFLALIFLAGFLLFFKLPGSGRQPLAVEFFLMIKHDLVPRGVDLMVADPFASLLVEIKVAFFLAFIFLLPLLLWQILAYLRPALKGSESRAIAKVVWPSSLLFALGCFFAYKLLIPTMIKLLYSYAPGLGAIAFLAVGDFISLVFIFMFATGLLFLLPVFMFLMSYLGLITPGFWRAYWRQAMLVFLIGAAIITPDGTGVTMGLLFIPLCLLYGLGLLTSAQH